MEIDNKRPMMFNNENNNTFEKNKLKNKIKDKNNM